MIEANRVSRHGDKYSGKRTQDWTPGSIVRVGFLTLMVTGVEQTPGDGMPDVYLLQSAKGKRYRFTPHHGLEVRHDN